MRIYADAKILIVDDQQTNVDLLVSMLEIAGYKDLTGLTDPGRVRDLHLESRFDLILLDLKMPEIDGFEVLRQLSGITVEDYAPVLVLTAVIEEPYRAKAFELGARDYITKPFDQAEVLNRIHNLLEVRMLHKGLEQRVEERTKDLQESEERFRFAFENAPIGMTLVAPDGTWINANKALADFLGYAAEDMTGTSMTGSAENVVELDECMGLRQRVLNGELATYHIERRYRHKRGHVVWGRESGSLFRNEDGKPEHFIIHTVDITERKKTEEALQRSEENLKAFVDNAPALVSLKSLAGQYLMMNQEYERLFGIELQSAVGESARSAFPDDIAELFELQEKEVIDRKETVTREQVIPHPDGDRVHLCTKFPVANAAGTIHAIGTISTDITDKKAVEKAMLDAKEQAELANRAKTEFLAHMSHELRTPLNSVIGFGEVLEKGVFGPLGHFKYQEYAKDIGDSGSHLLSLISNILDISKIEAGELDFFEETIDVGEIFESSARMVMDRAARNGIALNVDVPQGLPPMRGDEVRLKQILLNLLSNAVKFTPKGGQVSVEATIDNDNAMVWEVADTGVGIAADDLERILNPFEKVRGNAAISHEGTGLGLYLTNALTEMHGGTLAIDSEPAKGTTVTVRFPPERTVAT